MLSSGTNAAAQHKPPAFEPKKLSIVIPCYNQARFVGEAIESALGQVGAAVDVIVVNDGSTDETPAVVKQYGHRIRAFHQPNQGLSATRNRGFAEASGKYIVFLDSDDVYERHACKNMLLTAERTGADVVSGRVTRVLLSQDKTTGWYKRLFTGRAVYRGEMIPAASGVSIRLPNQGVISLSSST